MERGILISKLKSLKTVKDHTKHLFASAFSPICLSKKQVLTFEETRSIYYLVDGFTLGGNLVDHLSVSKSYPIQLQQVGNFIMPQTVDQKHYQLLALKCSKLLKASFNQLKEIIMMDPNVIDIINYIQAEVREQQLQHIRLLTITHAKCRYEVLAQMLGTNLYHIPQKFLAPYLGISRKHLGRINRLKLTQRQNNDLSTPTSSRVV